MTGIHKIVALALSLACLALSGCEGKKQLVIITEQLPIRTSALYGFGGPFPGFDWNNPKSCYELTPSPDNAFIFTYEGHLEGGWFKAGTTPGTWSQSFLRPPASDEAVSEIPPAGLAETAFKVSPDFVDGVEQDRFWHLQKGGEYRLTFNLYTCTIKVEPLN